MIRIGDQDFTARSETYEVMLGREELDEREGEAIDEVNAIAVELQHTQGALLALADAEGAFDPDARDKILMSRRDLRARMRTARRALIRLRLETIALRLDPTPEAGFLVRNLDEDALDQVIDALNARPTRTGSDPVSDES